MHPSDVAHPNAALETKLRRLYTLRAAKYLTLGFRPEYLDLLKAFGNPHLALPPVIHVAGTNGKGSTIAALRAMLEADGKRIHTYTSPHLQRFNERIVLNGQEISNTALEALIDQALELNAERESTFFEITTAIAFAAFAKNPADFLLLETGLGGRLDCTNIIEKPLITIITALGMDHQDILGPKIENIAYEKSGIIKREVSCIIGAQAGIADTASVYELIQSRAKDLNAPLFMHGEKWRIAPHGDAQMRFEFDSYEKILPLPNLIGVHQIYNAGNALAALYVMNTQNKTQNWPIENYKNGLSRISWKGRFEKIEPERIALQMHPESEFWFDGGHNAEGAKVIASQLQEWAKHDPKPLQVIFAMKGDKNAAAFLEQIMPFAEHIAHIDLEGVSTFLNEASFIEIMKSFDTTIKYSHSPNIEHAIKSLNHAHPSRILLCGSLYLAKQLP